MNNQIIDDVKKVEKEWGVEFHSKNVKDFNLVWVLDLIILDRIDLSILLDCPTFRTISFKQSKIHIRFG